MDPLVQKLVNHAVQRVSQDAARLFAAELHIVDLQHQLDEARAAAAPPTESTEASP